MNLRAFFRIDFPLGARPWLVLDDCVLPVLDCSERGLRVLAPGESRPETNRFLRGRIRFPTGEETEITGTVLRETEDGAAILLHGRGISFATILSLQLHLRRRFWLAEEDDEVPEGGVPLSLDRRGR